MAEATALLALGAYGPALSIRLGNERSSVLSMAMRPFQPAQLSLVLLGEHANGELTPGAPSVVYVHSAYPSFDFLQPAQALGAAAKVSGFQLGFGPLEHGAQGNHLWAGAVALVGQLPERTSTVTAQEHAAWALQHTLVCRHVSAWDWWRLAAPLAGHRPKPGAVAALQAFRNLHASFPSTEAAAEAVGLTEAYYRQVHATVAERVRGACRDLLGDVATGLDVPAAQARFHVALPPA